MHKSKIIYLPDDDVLRQDAIAIALQQIDADNGIVLSHSHESRTVIIIYKAQPAE